MSTSPPAYVADPRQQQSSTAQTDMNDDPPPPYDDVEASHRLFGCIQNTLIAERGGKDDDPTETESMRKFLLYCLAVDYRFIGHRELPASERGKYIEMWGLMCRIRDSHENTHINELERSTLAPYFWKYLQKPCDRLSIPVEYAIKVIQRFVKYTSAFNRYKGCAYGLLQSAGAKALAHKLWQDRNILIPQLADNGHIREGLTACLVEFARQYFVSIDGVNSNIVADRGRGWDENSDISYTLTARGLWYGVARGNAIGSSVGDYARNSWDTIMSCMSDLESRRDIFPQGKLDSDRRATWNGPGLELSGNPSDEGLRSTVRGWAYYPENHLPDFFEHRPGQDRCES